MELKLKIHSKNIFPKAGIFIKSAAAEVWLREIQNMGLTLDAITVFPVPGLRANEVFGCLVVFNKSVIKTADIGKNNFYQLVENKLFIPENTIVTPQLTAAEWHKLFSEAYHFLHPEIGLAELKEEVNWGDLLELPVPKEIEITEPSKTVSIPQLITSLRVEVDQEKILEEIENPVSEEERIAKLPFDLQKLMKGNQKEMDKFLAFLEKNPKLALQLAIPLDTLGTSRGGNDGQFSFGGSGMSNFLPTTNSSSKIFKFGLIVVLIVLAGNFKMGQHHSGSESFFIFLLLVIMVVLAISLFSGNSSADNTSKSGGSALIDSDRFATLQSRYEKLAEEYAANKDYHKAAHIYLKLLSNHKKAAEVLEKGELYPEAAAIYLKYDQNKHKAAECYEKGHAYKEAIELYKELNEDEKAGDLYTILKDKPKADHHFNKVAEYYKTNYQYIKASLIYKNKINDITEAQELLLEGWKTNKDAKNCLNNYFANIHSAEELAYAISDVYKNRVSGENRAVFLHLLKHEFTKHAELEEMIKNMAYEIAAERIDQNPEIASELLNFNKDNRLLLKDVMKYKLHFKK